MSRKYWGVLGASCALALVSVIGCGGGSGKSETTTRVSPTRAQLIGTWKYSSIGNAVLSQTACPAGVNDVGGDPAAYCGASDTLQLNADNTFVSNTTKLDRVTVVRKTGQWKLEGNDMTLLTVVGNAGTSEGVSVSLSNDAATLYFNSPLIPTTTVLTKQ